MKILQRTRVLNGGSILTRIRAQFEENNEEPYLDVIQFLERGLVFCFLKWLIVHRHNSASPPAVARGSKIFSSLCLRGSVV